MKNIKVYFKNKEILRGHFHSQILFNRKIYKKEIPFRGDGDYYQVFTYDYNGGIRVEVVSKKGTPIDMCNCFVGWTFTPVTFSEDKKSFYVDVSKGTKETIDCNIKLMGSYQFREIFINLH